jgi:hypothetical protein
MFSSPLQPVARNDGFMIAEPTRHVRIRMGLVMGIQTPTRLGNSNDIEIDENSSIPSQKRASDN